MENEATPPTPRPRRTRKPATPRTRKPKDPGILAIEANAKAAKEEYRKAQASGAILKRIMDKLLPRLTEAHRQALYDALSKTVTPELVATRPPNARSYDAGAGTDAEALPPYGSPAWAAAAEK